jgi:hypothetical protein
MNRRRFFAQLAGVAAITGSRGADAPATDPALAHARVHSVPHCACGYQLYRVRQEANRLAEIWTCCRCHKSWRVPYQWVSVERVEYEDGR